MFIALTRALLLVCVYFSVIAGQKCGRYSCHGDVGNLVAGRTVKASSTCGENGGEIFCDPGQVSCDSPQCRRCKTAVKGHEHPSSCMTDSTFFHPRTWWQSSNDVTDVTLSFDLETTFYFTHLIMLFRSPRPGAMTIERSRDFGQSWKTYKWFARNCSETFGLDDDVDVDEAECTSRYSNPTPCHKGEVIYRVLNPLNLIEDPYSDEARHLMKITNIRIRMWNPQLCETCTDSSITDTRILTSPSPLDEEAESEDALWPLHSSRHFTRFALYDLIIRGTCFCNGHADTCVPLHEDASEPDDREQDVVHGKCVCEHNTAGVHCGRCLPLYNDAPWKPGNGDTGAANPCKRCNCHGHADKCRFDFDLYVASGNRTGGVCLDCQHNTEGRHCASCKPGFFRRLDAELSDQDVCQECQCHGIGSLNSSFDIDGDDDVISCDVTTGECACKPGVAGRRCDRCLKGFWGFGEEGCTKCDCERCEQKTGVCLREFGDEEISFVDSIEENEGQGYDLTEETFRDVLGESRIFRPPVTDSTQYPRAVPRFPDSDGAMLAAYPDEPLVVSRVDGEYLPDISMTWQRPSKCTCVDRKFDDPLKFCKMKYDYAVKLKVREAIDLGHDTNLSVFIRRIFKQNTVKIRRGKMTMYPESWTIMGCTCPFLKPGQDYLVIGHEEPLTGRLMINVESIVENWWDSRGRNWPRTVKKYFRKDC